MENANKIKIIVALCMLIVLGVGLIQVANNYASTKNKEIQVSQSKKKKRKNKVKTVSTRSRDETLDNEILTYLNEAGIDMDKIAYSICDQENGEVYSYNEDTEFTAASTYKLPLAMLYYDKINNGEITLETTYQLLPNMYEDNSIIAADYSTYSQVPLSEILENMIVWSDNVAGHILYENLGGWKEYKEATLKYTSVTTDNYISYDNVITAHQMNDILNYLYENQDSYSDLIQYMKESKSHDYLDKEIQIDMPQKYGAIDAYCNAAGFVEATHPYTIAVYTDLADEGVEIMAHINQIVYNHFN